MLSRARIDAARRASTCPASDNGSSSVNRIGDGTWSSVRSARRIEDRIAAAAGDAGDDFELFTWSQFGVPQDFRPADRLAEVPRVTGFSRRR